MPPAAPQDEVPPRPPDPVAVVVQGRTARSLLSAGVYSSGFAVQRAIGLITLPLFTRALSTSDYGSVGLLTAIYAVASILFAAGLETSILRTYFQLERDPSQRVEFIDSVWRFLIGFPLAGAMIASALTVPILSGSSPDISGLDVVITLFAAAAGTAGTVVPLTVLRARQNLSGYLKVTAVSTVLTPGLSVIFVVVLDQGVSGWFLAVLIANLATMAAAMLIIPWKKGGQLRWHPVRTALLFSLPLMPHFLSHWALQLADRGIIAGIRGASELGIYTVASSLATVILMLVMALNQGFTPTYAQARGDAVHRRELELVVVLQIAGVAAITLAGMLLGPSAVEILTAPDFHSAESLLPWLALGYGFLGLYFIPMNGATLGAGRRSYAWVATAGSAAVNIVLLLIFVPLYGLIAAAMASAAAYLMLLVLIAWWAHSGQNPVHYAWRPILATLAAGALAYVGSVLTGPADVFPALMVRSLWLTAFLVTTGLLLWTYQRRST